MTRARVGKKQKKTPLKNAGVKRKARKRKTPLKVEVGDNVMVKSGSPDEPSYVGLVVDHRKDKLGNKQLKLQWYYRPEDSRAGRQAWHGEKELFASHVCDWNSMACVESTCNVHTLEEYEDLDYVDDMDFYNRFNYDPKSGNFRPDVVPVYCECEHPFNPDRDMVMCEYCQEWFHCDCVNWAPEAEGNFYCRDPDCQRAKKKADSKKKKK